MRRISDWIALVGQVTGLVSLVILFLTYRSQVETNSAQRRFEAYSLVRSDLDVLRKQVEDLKYHTLREDGNDTLMVLYEGRAAVEEFIDDLGAQDRHDSILTHPFFADLYFVLGRFDVVLRRVAEADLSESFREDALRDLCFFYSNKLIIGMIRLQSLEEQGRLRITVAHGEMNQAVHLNMMLDVQKKMTAVIMELGM